MLGLGRFPEQGIQRDDIRLGLRVLGCERRTMIAFHITAAEVVIDRILHGGRDIHSAFDT